MKYDILFIIPSLCRASLLCFKKWRLLHLFQSCSINFKRFFAPFILANQRRDTAPLNRIHDWCIPRSCNCQLFTHSLPRFIRALVRIRTVYFYITNTTLPTVNWCKLLRAVQTSSKFTVWCTIGLEMKWNIIH